MRSIWVLNALGTSFLGQSCSGQSLFPSQVSQVFRSTTGQLATCLGKLEHYGFRATQRFWHEQQQPDSLGKNWRCFWRRKGLSGFLKGACELEKKCFFLPLAIFVEQDVAPDYSDVFWKAKAKSENSLKHTNWKAETLTAAEVLIKTLYLYQDLPRIPPWSVHMLSILTGF